MNRIFAILIFASAAFVACDRGAVYDQSVTIPHEKWNVDSLAVFTMPVTDTISAYNLYIYLRNTNDYQFQNLYLFVDVIALNYMQE